MKPTEIQENLELAQNILGMWLRYRQYFEKGISGAEIIPEEDSQFKETTSTIAQGVRKLAQRMDDKQFPLRQAEISSQLKGAISIEYFRRMPVTDQKLFYNEWHTNMIYLCRMVGALKFLAEGYVPLPPKVPVGKGGKGGKGGKAAGKKAFPVKIVVAVVVVLAVAGYFIFA